ncbi:exodeoxyribonuclease VII small subunit [Brachybacterium saurashtrense]|uniref:Exodeoxyribonuclease 7 small subunit n=1 Tax=Brachybacterium saurashtrense TaxID=556288 RepID=A0A345YP73_9MICO|nr:exodeoxyribonuclease VII small subunit [Brachybacterium saurashtrense]RRR24743.1 exodeoxyribonuclease VII small subunit [Brachybacterium saurashtrense]
MTPSTRPDDDPTAPAPAEGTGTDGAGTGAATAPVTPAEDPQPLPEDIAALSYEAARDQLVEVVRRLESGQGGLEDSIGLWERGEMLARRCQQWLDGARDRLDDAVAARRAEGHTTPQE